jgi:hypothetical protein
MTFSHPVLRQYAPEVRQNMRQKKVCARRKTALRIFSFWSRPTCAGTAPEREKVRRPSGSSP